MCFSFVACFGVLIEQLTELITHFDEIPTKIYENVLDLLGLPLTKSNE